MRKKQIVNAKPKNEHMILNNFFRPLHIFPMLLGHQETLPKHSYHSSSQSIQFPENRHICLKTGQVISDKFFCRVIFGSEKQAIPWLGSFKSSIDDWVIVLNDAQDKEESIADVFSKHSDERVSIFIEGGPSKGFTKQSCERDVPKIFFRKNKYSSASLP